MSLIKGSYSSKTFTKKASDISALEWILIGIFIIALGSSEFVMMKLMVAEFLMILGFAFLDFMAFCYIFSKDYKNPILLLFVTIGILIEIAGLLLKFSTTEIVIYYISITLAIIYLLIGIISLIVGYKRKRENKKCTVMVEAICSKIDVKSINTFAFDDIVKHNYFSELNKDQLIKPTFKYIYNGKEYEESYDRYIPLNSYRINEKENIYINPNKPNVFAFTNSHKIILLFGWLWMFIIFIAVITFLILQSTIGLI